jgi:hypothetical protein
MGQNNHVGAAWPNETKTTVYSSLTFVHHHLVLFIALPFPQDNCEQIKDRSTITAARYRPLPDFALTFRPWDSISCIGVALVYPSYSVFSFIL